MTTVRTLDNPARANNARVTMVVPDLIDRVKLRWTAAKNMGFLNMTAYEAQKLRLRFFPPSAPIWLSSRHIVHPVQCRPGTSDIDVFGQIFAMREYRCLDAVSDVDLIIDCGSNVGYSAAYFLSRYPKARLIAVEPDASNFALLKANLAPYAGRFEALRTCVWSHATDSVMEELPFRDGREWARTTRPARAGEEATMTSIDIGSILARSGADRISILKIDIEGAEAEVFSKNYESWLGKVDNLVVELHSEKARSIFLNAIAGEGFATSESDELFVCQRQAA